ncbi:hypothetical protein K502DRAFT_323063 [Neoconidiobolus thromboides FSU 785]|nr:hypothetical protein K502DRAFT_323063 [Neoconidiobolus thromboides FSU 785]
MPPKKQAPTKADKDRQKAKAKVAEDKTFGLKNKKKSAKVGRYVEEVKKQAQHIGNPKLKAAEEEKALQKKKREEEEARKKELHDLFKPIVVTQKVPFGTDPKTVLCAHFKAGTCIKGKKCKFSHDLNAERKGAKRDLYTDSRDETKENDTMDTWDDKKLAEVVLSKHGNPKTTTDIVCKFFLEAIDNQKYGWFWECPNGGLQCKYRHALPPGFVLKSKKKEEIKQEISLDEFLETERHKLGTNLTPVTLETFTEWKKKRLEKIEKEENELKKQKDKAMQAGRNLQLSGRELFDYNPDLAFDNEYDDDEDAFEVDAYRIKENNEDESVIGSSKMMEQMSVES